MALLYYELRRRASTRTSLASSMRLMRLIEKCYWRPRRSLISRQPRHTPHLSRDGYPLPALREIDSNDCAVGPYVSIAGTPQLLT
jgi:hypothetical protein